MDFGVHDFQTNPDTEIDHHLQDSTGYIWLITMIIGQLNLIKPMNCMYVWDMGFS